jgi:hypothetical protein
MYISRKHRWGGSFGESLYLWRLKKVEKTCQGDAVLHSLFITTQEGTRVRDCSQITSHCVVKVLNKFKKLTLQLRPNSEKTLNFLQFLFSINSFYWFSALVTASRCSTIQTRATRWSSRTTLRPDTFPIRNPFSDSCL